MFEQTTCVIAGSNKYQQVQPHYRVTRNQFSRSGWAYVETLRQTSGQVEELGNCSIEELGNHSTLFDIFLYHFSWSAPRARISRANSRTLFCSRTDREVTGRALLLPR